MLLKYSRLAWLMIVSIMATHAFQARANDAPQPAGKSEPSPVMREIGVASFYGQAHHGKLTASGRLFDQMGLTAAHPWLPFGTRLLVTIQSTGRSVIVVVTDRLYHDSRIVDLSLGAARQLGMISQGIAHVSLVRA